MFNFLSLIFHPLSCYLGFYEFVDLVCDIIIIFRTNYDFDQANPATNNPCTRDFDRVAEVPLLNPCTKRFGCADKPNIFVAYESLWSYVLIDLLSHKKGRRL